MSTLRLFAAATLLVGACYCPVQAGEHVKAYIYYATTPFVTDADTHAGLAQDLVDYLNRALAGKYEIKLEVVPRARLNVLLDQGEPALVLFVPSVIFGGVDGGKFLWSAPLLMDRQELVSRWDKPFEFTGPASLFNVRLGGVLGHSYPALEPEMSTGKIQMYRNVSEASLLKMLNYGRLDVVTMARSSLRHIQNNNPELKNAFHESRISLGKYSRHVMFQKNMTTERDDIDAVVGKMGKDQAWQTILSKYGLASAPLGHAQAATSAVENCRVSVKRAESACGAAR